MKKVRTPFKIALGATLLIGAVGIGYTYYTTKQQEKEYERLQIPTEIQNVQPFSEMDHFNSLPKEILTENFALKINVGDKGTSFRKKLYRNELITEGYISFQVQTNGKPLGIYEDIYFKVNGIGGHIIPDYNLLETQEEDNSTTYLLNLASITFKPSINSKNSEVKESFNFLELINTSKEVDIIIDVSSNNKLKTIIKSELAITCNNTPCFDKSKK